MNIYLDEERKNILHVGFPEHVTALKGDYRNRKFYPEDIEFNPNLSGNERRAILRLLDSDGGIPL